jgi:hypothetical protein
MTHRIRAWLVAALLGIAWTVAPSSPSDAQGEISGGVVKLGVLTDETGVFSSLSGEGSIEATRMAVEDFGGKAAGKPIEIIHADHQNKTDIGAAIARRWIDVDGVDVIIDVPNSAIVLAVQQLAKEKNRVLLASTAGTADLTGKACSPVGVHWTWDTYAFAASSAKSIVQRGGNSWFFLTADFAFGHAMQRDATRVIEAAGAATVYRNYFAPIGSAYGQTKERQFDGLAILGEALAKSLNQPVQALWSMRNGYALCTGAGLDKISNHIRSLPQEELDILRSKLCIGIHRDVEVTDAPGAHRPTVSQAFCSALPVAYTNIPSSQWEPFASLILEAAYESTMWSAVLNAQRGASNIVLLTLLGGGAFGNREDWIIAAIRRALAMISAFDLDVRLVSYRAPSQSMLRMVEHFKTA